MTEVTETVNAPTTLTAHAVELLRGIQQDIQKSIDQKQACPVEMHDWVTLTDDSDTSKFVENAPIPADFCGTVGCIAGTLALQAGWRPLMYKNIDGEWRCSMMMAHKDHPMPKDASGIGVEILNPGHDACSYNDLSDAIVDLFYMDGEIWDDLSTSYPPDIITAIDRFIEAHS